MINTDHSVIQSCRCSWRMLVLKCRFSVVVQISAAELPGQTQAVPDPAEGIPRVEELSGPRDQARPCRVELLLSVFLQGTGGRRSCGGLHMCGGLVAAPLLPFIYLCFGEEIWNWEKGVNGNCQRRACLQVLSPGVGKPSAEHWRPLRCMGLL